VNPTEYFATARERYAIRLKRLAGMPAPWTDDPVFQGYRFCNVHREHDRTTQWFAEHVRSKLTGLRVVEATLIFRWFNRIETAELVEDLLLDGWNTDEARTRLEHVKPVVTGAYMIKTEMGMTKLDGVLYAIEKALPKLPRMVEKWGSHIQNATMDLTQIHGIGPFLAYEITSDLRWTPVLNEAADIMTWANAGPGCAHGLSRLYDKEDPWKWNRGKPEHQAEMVELMYNLLELSQSENYWPIDWQPWEMREVEHWACEFDKHCRGSAGDHLKRRYRA
jgi:hypothetical protein